MIAYAYASAFVLGMVLTFAVLMKNLILTFFLGFLCTAMYSQEYPGKRAIREMHEGWVIVRLPDFDKRMHLLDSLASREGLSEKDRQSFLKVLDRTRRDSLHVHLLYPLAFDSLFTFSRYAFLKTHETQDFLAGKVKARTSTGDFVHIAEGEPMFFMNLPVTPTKPVRCTTKDHLPLSYPFPTNLGVRAAVYSGFPLISTTGTTQVHGQVVNARAKAAIEKHVFKLNERLRSFLLRHGLSENKE